MDSEKVRRSRSPLSWLLVWTVALFWVAGCGGEVSSPPVPKGKLSAAAKKTEPPKAEETKDPGKKEEEYVYNPKGKPDPFKPFIQLTPIRDASRSVPLTPLQKYEVSQLKLVAILSSGEGSVALVEDSTGKGYFVKKGTLIGKNDGKVTRILRDRVVVQEVYQDIFGQTKVNEIPIMLHRVEEGGES